MPFDEYNEVIEDVRFCPLCDADLDGNDPHALNCLNHEDLVHVTEAAEAKKHGDIGYRETLAAAHAAGHGYAAIAAAAGVKRQTVRELLLTHAVRATGSN